MKLNSKINQFTDEIIDKRNKAGRGYGVKLL